MDNATKQKLWKTADQLRSNMDAAEYKHVVLGLIFLKYISDSFSTLRTTMQEDEYYRQNPQYMEEDMRAYAAQHNAFWVPQEARWEFLRNNAPQPNIGKLIDDAMLSIEKENPKLKNILNKNYARLSLPQGRLADLINTISTIGFEDGQTAPDTLGEVYEYFLGMFADAELAYKISKEYAEEQEKKMQEQQAKQLAAQKGGGTGNDGNGNGKKNEPTEPTE